jgi:hypothetical protein
MLERSTRLWQILGALTVDLHSVEGQFGGVILVVGPQRGLCVACTCSIRLLLVLVARDVRLEVVVRPNVVTLRASESASPRSARETRAR